MWPGRYFGARFWCARYWCKVGADPGGPVFVRRPNMMRVGSRGDWIFKTVN